MTQTLRAFLLILLIVPRSVTAAEQADASFDAQALELVWNRAHLEADTPALDALWADDITIVVPGMAPLGKADALKIWRAVPVKFTQYESSDLSARVEGTTAVVTGGIARARTFGGRSAKERWYFTKVYRFSGNAWRVIAFHASNAPDSTSP